MKGIDRRDFLKSGAIAALGLGLHKYVKADACSEPSCRSEYHELPGSATDWAGEVILHRLYDTREELATILSDKSNLIICDSYHGRPDKKMIIDKIDEWKCNKNLLFGNVPRLERLNGPDKEKINFGEVSGECEAKMYVFEGMPLDVRKEIEGGILQKSLPRGSQTVISNYWMLEAIKSNPVDFYKLYDDVFHGRKGRGRGKTYLKNAQRGLQQGIAQFIRIPTHYDDTSSMCATMDFIPSLRNGDVYLYYIPAPACGDPALKLEAYHEDIAEFKRFFQRYIDDHAGLCVLGAEYSPGKNILELPLE